MSDQFFLSATGAESAAAAGSRVLWTGRCAVAEYAFEEPSSLPRWTLPEETEVVVTEDRVVYRDGASGATGELRWPGPQHLRVQPGNRDTGRSATVTQIQLVCAGPGGSYPALVFAGGDLATVGDADRLANVLRQAIARYRVEHAGELGIPAPQVRMLTRLVIGPEFNNYQGGEGQTVSLLGSVGVRLPVSPAGPRAGGVYGAPIATYAPPPPAPEPVVPAPAPIPIPAPALTPAPGWPIGGRADFGTAPPQVPRPGFDQYADTHPARPADDAVLRGTDDLELRAADLAARVADLISTGTMFDRYETETTNLSAYLDGTDDPDTERAEQARRTAARLAGNAARSRGTTPRRSADDEMGTRNY